MPELPEVESIRLFLADHLIGKKIQDIEILVEKMFKGEPKEIIGSQITDVLRNGKILILQLAQPKTNRKIFISTHLKLAGQILYAANKDKAIFKNIIPRTNTKKMPGRTTRIIIHFSDNSVLYFNDLRKFGWMKVGDNPETVKGVDILAKEFTEKYFTNAINKTVRPIKVVITDQEKLAGAGNIYANEALWFAKIHPARKANSLNHDEIKLLHRAIIAIIKEGLRHKGSSAQDELYMLPDSEKGGYQNHMKVYHQHDKPCQRCGTLIKRMKLGGRGTFFCPECQKLE